MVLSTAAFSISTNKVLLVCAPQLQSFDGLVNSWISVLTKYHLKNDISTYIGFPLADDTNDVLIDAYYRRSNSMGTKDEALSAIKKLTSADIALFSVVRKTNRGFTVSADLVDMKELQVLASVSSNSKSKSEADIFSGKYSCVDDLTMQLCKVLDIHISELATLVLKNGTSSLSNEDRVAWCEEKSAIYVRQLQDISKRKVGDIDEEYLEKALRGIDIERYTLQKNMKENTAESKRASDAIKARETDAEKNKTRGYVARKIRDRITATLTANPPHDDLYCNLLAQLEALQAKKCALVEIKNNVATQRDEIISEYEKTFLLKKRQIEDRPYTKSELDDTGKPSTMAIVNRNAEIEKAKNLSDKEANSRVLVLEATTKNQIDLLQKQIESDTATIKGGQRCSSLSGDIRPVYSAYDAEKDEWTVDLYVYSRDALLTKYTTKVNYNDLPNANESESATQKTEDAAPATTKSKGKKKSPKAKKAKKAASTPAKAPYKNTNPSKFSDFDGYMTVSEAFDSLFINDLPIFNFILEYSVDAEDGEKYTTFTISVKKLDLVDAINNRQIFSHSLNSKTTLKLMNQYDYRDEKTIKADEEKFRSSVDSVLDRDAIEIEEPEVQSE